MWKVIGKLFVLKRLSWWFSQSNNNFKESREKKNPLIEKQLYTAFHLYSISLQDNRTGLQHLLLFSNKYIPRNDDSLMYVSLEDRVKCYQQTWSCVPNYTLPYRHHRRTWSSITEKIKVVSENYERAVKLSESYNGHHLQTNKWLLSKYM